MELMFSVNIFFFRHEFGFVIKTFCFLENEIQLAGYKILNALWIIGTQGLKFIDR